MVKKLHFITLACALFLAMASCSGDGKVNKAAKAYGSADAKTLIEQAPHMSQLEMEGYLLGVRATEYKYIEEGHKKAAKLYIDGFEVYMRENCDSLAKIIF